MIKIVMVDKSVSHIWDMHEGDYFRPTGSDSILLKTGDLRAAVEIRTGKIIQIPDLMCLEKLDNIEMRVIL